MKTSEAMDKHIAEWLNPADDELERIKAEARAETRAGAHVLIGRDLLRLIAAIRNMRGGCPNCGQIGSHRGGCKAKGGAQ